MIDNFEKMGKPKKKNQSGSKRKRQPDQMSHKNIKPHSNTPHNKRRKKKGFWIEECKESYPKKGTVAGLTILITQSDLTDDHAQAVANNKLEDVVVAEDDTAPYDKEEKNSMKDMPQDNKESTTEDRDNKSLEEQVAEREHNVPAAAADGKADSNNKSPNFEETDATLNTSTFISVRRDPSASGKDRMFPSSPDFHHLPGGDCGDGILNPHSDVQDKYWAQRKRLFSRFDQGVQLDTEGWYSVTPEAIALHVANRIVKTIPDKKRGLVILDAFCGCGGNAIAFARHPDVSLVVCVDLDQKKLEMAASNAKIYEIPPQKLLFVHDNVISVLEQWKDRAHEADSSRKESKLRGDYVLNGSLPERLDCIFLSPPWGGTAYQNVGKSHYDLVNCIQISGNEQEGSNSICNGEQLLEHAARIQKSIVYFLPRNINGIALGRSAMQAGYTGDINMVELEKNMLNGKFKTVTAYFGLGDRDIKS